MVLGYLDRYMQKKKMKVGYEITPYTRINSRWIEDLNISRDTVKVLVENTSGEISDILHNK